MTFASPFLADGISSKTSYVQLLDEFESSGEHQCSSYTLHVMIECLLVHISTVSTNLWQPKRCPACHGVTTTCLVCSVNAVCMMVCDVSLALIHKLNRHSMNVHTQLFMQLNLHQRCCASLGGTGRIHHNVAVHVPGGLGFLTGSSGYVLRHPSSPAFVEVSESQRCLL